MSYERLGVVEFGEALIKTQDLDPLYTMLVGALDKGILSQPRLAYWLTSYVCFYHAGVASYMTERAAGDDDFWRLMKQAAANEERPSVPGFERWPRAAERRHFRGEAANLSVAELSERHPRPAGFWEEVYGGPKPVPFAPLIERVKSHRGFGDWIAFKIADLTDRVLRIPVAWTPEGLFLYKQPADSAVQVARLRHILQGKVRGRRDITVRVVEELISDFAGLMAPPTFDRAVGIPEVETVLCKWKSHQAGRYPVGHDTHEIRGHLNGWGFLADDMAGLLPEIPK